MGHHRRKTDLNDSVEGIEVSEICLPFGWIESVSLSLTSWVPGCHKAVSVLPLVNTKACRRQYIHASCLSQNIKCNLNRGLWTSSLSHIHWWTAASKLY